MTPTRPHVSSNIDTLSLRQALGEFATGVTVITSRAADGRPVGLTVNSFASVSLDPPLILWSLGLGSPSLRVFQECTHFAVNVLAADQQELSERFAQSLSDKFSGLDSRVGAGDTVLLPDCCAWFECKNEAQHSGGDHLILVGRVLSFTRQEKAPLIFHGGRYRKLK